MKTIHAYMKPIAALLALLLLLTGGLLSAASDCGIYRKLLRLHVLANSDSPADQALKLEVRDTVLSTLSPLFEADYADLAALEEAVTDALPELTHAAEKTVADAGYTYPVRASLQKEAYPTRVYENVTLPAGVYHSLKIEIGNAEGHNWWCVLYPPLCLSAAQATEPKEKSALRLSDEEALMEVGLTKEEATVVMPASDDGKIHLRFRFLELIGELRGLFA